MEDESDFYFQKGIGMIARAIALRRCNNAKPLDRQIFLSSRFGLILKDIEPFFYDYDIEADPDTVSLTKQGFILYFQRTDNWQRMSIMLCFYYDFRFNRLGYYFHPDPKSSRLQNYDEVYKIAKNYYLNQWVLNLSFIKDIYHALRTHFSKGVCDDLVSEKELKALNKDLLLKRIYFNKQSDPYDRPFEHVLPKWRLDIICYVHQYVKKEENDAENVDQGAATTDDNTAAVSS